jgi:hypothetical protein
MCDPKIKKLIIAIFPILLMIILIYTTNIKYITVKDVINTALQLEFNTNKRIGILNTMSNECIITIYNTQIFISPFTLIWNIIVFVLIWVLMFIVVLAFIFILLIKSVVVTITYTFFSITTLINVAINLSKK